MDTSCIFCRVDWQRKPNEPAYWLNIDGQQRLLNDLQTALSMVVLRPADERDANYEDDYAEIIGIITDTEEELRRLREAEFKGK